MKKIVAKHIPYSITKSFTKLVEDYLEENSFFEPYIQAYPSINEIPFQIERKKKQSFDRLLLSNTLQKQYSNISINENVKSNLELLKEGNTFTICTAHQPNIFTGYLYFIYKIIHAINLAIECKTKYSEYNFVPIYYMGSEDNDIDEIGIFHYNDQTFNWHPNQSGACGRMSTKGLIEFVSEIKKTFNEIIIDEKELIVLLEKAYDGINTLAEGTRILVNGLFGQFGLVVLDGDDSAFKHAFQSVIEHELLKRNSQHIVLETVSKISEKYKLQANPREINLFYLLENKRERIEYSNEYWNVLNTEIKFNESQLLDELNKYPDRFSPNVILRPLYQETLLPNIAFIGGGGELGYWLELKALFEFHNITYPLLFLRNSVLWIEEKIVDKINKLELPLERFFEKQDVVFHDYISKHQKLNSLNEIKVEMEIVFQHLREMGNEISPNLAKSMEAHIAKIIRIENRIEQKVKSNLKKQDEFVFNQIQLIKNNIAPNGVLQERYLNFMTIYKQLGKSMIDSLIQYQSPFGNEFLILIYSSNND